MHRLPGIATLLIMLFLGTLLLSGCPGQEQRKPVSPSMKIGVSLADMERDGNQVIKKVMDEHKKRRQVEVIWRDAGGDPRKQEEQIKEMINQRVRAVILQVVNPADGPGLVRQLVQQNIKVVALDTLPVNTPVDAYVAPDHNRAGQLLARFVDETLQKAAGSPEPGMISPEQAGVQVEPRDAQEDVRINWGSQGPPPGMDEQGKQGQAGQDRQSGQQEQQGGQKQQGQRLSDQIPPEEQIKGRTTLHVFILQGDPGDNALRDIAASARAALQANRQIKVAGVITLPGNEPSQVPALLQQAVSQNGNRVDVILGSDSRFVVAAVDALMAEGLKDRVITAGVGADRQSYMSMTRGDHDAEVDTMPEMQASYALDAAVTLAKGENWQYDTRIINGDYSIPARITPVRLVQRENIYLLDQRWEQRQQGGQQQGGQQQEEQQEGQEQQDSQEQQGGQAGQQGGDQQGQQGQQGKTILRITTMDGKTVEMQVDGQVQRIEAVGGQQGGGQGQGQSQGQGSGQGGSQGDGGS